MFSTRVRQAYLSPRSNHGFTLVELLVVIGLSALLISILLPALGKARSSAQKAACLSNQKQIVTAILMYCGDNHNTLPGPCLPMVIDPLNSNAQPGQSASQTATYNGVTLPTSNLTVWLGQTANPTWEPMQLSNSTLLQRYLGGIQSRAVWRCPGADMVFQAPVYSGTMAGKVPGFGYIVNNTGSYGNPATYPYYLFGAYSAIGASNPQVVAEDRVPKKLNQIMIALDNAKDATPLVNYIHVTRDNAKVWLISDFDGRNGDSTTSGSLNITGGASTTTTKNTFGYQPVHRANKSIPNGLGRNFGYLDGHAEFRAFGDWPGAGMGTN